MFVLTADQKGSRNDRDRVADALNLLAHIPTLAAFERTVGDEIQGVIAQPTDALTAVMLLIRDGHWHCGLGIGHGEFPTHSPHKSSEGRGPAFIAARTAVEKAKNLTPSVALEAPPSAPTTSHPTLLPPAQALLRLTASILEGRTPRQWQVIDAVKATQTGAQAGELLGISAPAVSQSLNASHAALEHEALAGLEILLRELDTHHTPPEA